MNRTAHRSPKQLASYTFLPINKSAWRYYSSFYRESYQPLLLSVITSIIQSLILLSIALLVRHVFDDLIPTGSFYLLALVGTGIVFLYLMNGGITLWTRYVILRTTKIAIQQVRDELLKRVYAFSRSYYSEADRSKLHTIMVQDTERLDVMSNALIAQLIPALFISVALSAVLTYLNWSLFLVMISIVPLLFVVSKSIGRAVRKRVQAFHRSFERFSRGMLFVLQMMDLTRIQSAEHFEIERQSRSFPILGSGTEGR